MQILSKSSIDSARDTRVVRAEEAWTLEALRSVWERQKDRVGERIEVIEHAIAELSEGRLDLELGREAERAAHMLAGSLGMFGFVGASDAAHCLEAELAHPVVEAAAAMSAQLEGLRHDIEGPVALLEVPVY